jgi:hypothetical protein
MKLRYVNDLRERDENLSTQKANTLKILFAGCVLKC